MSSSPAPGFYPPTGYGLSSVVATLYCNLGDNSAAFTNMDLTYNYSASGQNPFKLTESGSGSMTFEFPEAIAIAPGDDPPFQLQIVGTLQNQNAASVASITVTGTLNFIKQGSCTTSSPFTTDYGGFSLSCTQPISGGANGQNVQLLLTITDDVGGLYTLLSVPGSWSWAVSNLVITATNSGNQQVFTQTMSVDPEMELSDVGGGG